MKVVAWMIIPLTLIFPAAGRGVNLIANPGAESGTANWTSNGIFNATAHPRTGSYCFETKDNTPGSWVYARMSSAVNINSTHCYRMEGYYNLVWNTGTYAGGTPGFALEQSKSGVGVLKTLHFSLDNSTSGQDVWVYWSKTIGPWGSGCDVDFKSDADLFRFIVEPGGPYVSGIGRVLWDDVSFSQIDPPPPPDYLGNTLGISDTPPPPWPPMSGSDQEINCWNRKYAIGSLGLPSSIQTWGSQVNFQAGDVNLDGLVNAGDMDVLAAHWCEGPSATRWQGDLTGDEYVDAADLDTLADNWGSSRPAGTELLVRPVELRFTRSGQTLAWTPVSRQVTSATEAKIVIDGQAQSPQVGTLNYTTTAEFDGLMRFDFVLQPISGATVDTLELRIPLRKELLTLYWMNIVAAGDFQPGMGITYRNGWMNYCWYGNERCGLALISEDTQAVDIFRTPDPNLPPHCTAWRVEQTADTVEIIWSFIVSETPRVFTGPWTLTFGLQATPVKPLPANWRLLRSNAPNTNIEIHWPATDEIRYFSPPVPTYPAAYTQIAAGFQAIGQRFIPYSCLLWISGHDPEYVRNTDWGTGYIVYGDYAPDNDSFCEVYPTPAWTDYVVWLNHQIAQQYNTDGIYVDMSGVGYFTKPEAGLGYYRDGQPQPTRPFFAVRKIYQRAYTMFKALNPNSLLIAHGSGNVNIPYIAFCDVFLTGEGNWYPNDRGTLHDNYLDVISLARFRAEVMGHQYGFNSWFLPQWYGATLADTDVVSRGSDGWPTMVTVEKSHHLFGLGLLHDFSFWPICGMNPDAATQFYGVQDSFGIGDAEFFGYWENANLVGGQSDQIKASVYRKPAGGSLIVIYNTTRQEINASLTVDWDSLKSAGALNVTDAYTGQGVSVSGNTLTLTVPPINYRLIWVR